MSSPTQDKLARQYLIWVDGAGVFLVCLAEEITIGGLRNDDHRADICLMAPLPRKQITLTRQEGNLTITAHASTFCNNHPLIQEQATHLPLGNQEAWLQFQNIDLRIHQPTVLSSTVVLAFPIPHQPQVGQPPIAVDGVVFMDQNCLIGFGGGHHIPLDDPQDSLILYRSKNQLWCKSKTPFSTNNGNPETSRCLTSGDTITGSNFRFRLEAVSQ